ncbi:MAG: phosphatase PAP2 family protein [Ignavibacteria bacterium]|nr:phosphatase PAP2 family protein [Ignavibacteria bacterium]
MTRIKGRLQFLETHDWMNISFFLFLSLVSFIFVTQSLERFLLPVVNIFIIFFIVIIVSNYESKNYIDQSAPPFARFIRFWYPVFTILFCFKEVYVIMISHGDKLHDGVLAQIDRAIFGGNPTQMLHQFSHPYLTEFFQIVYGIFYLMPVIFASELYLWHRYGEFKYATFVIMFGFYLSFIGYLLVPAVGPRFVLHEFATTDAELPGVYLTQTIRDFINLGESIPKGEMNAILVAQRDAFPSGHTIVILLITYLSRKFRSGSFYFYLPYSLLMVFSTVYLRYHYVIDIIAAVPFVLATVFVSNMLYKNKLNGIAEFGAKSK